MRPVHACLKMALALWVGWALGACTRSVELVQTPMVPPLGMPASEGQATAGITLPTGTSPAEADKTLGATSTPPGALPDLRYAVIFLADGEVLNVRSGPGVMNAVVGNLPANTRDLTPTGGRTDQEGVTWIEINRPEGGAGWVSGDYLTEQISPAQACADPQVGVLLDELNRAVRGQDGAALSGLVSPAHGLTIHHNVWNPAVVLDEKQVFEALFASTVDYDWGFQDGSGETMVGPFKDLVLPKLEDVLLQEHTRSCNTLERGVATGSTTGFVYWPYDYASLNYVALFRPAPAGQEMDWRTWVVGIEYVDGKPYLAVLIQFHWEI